MIATGSVRGKCFSPHAAAEQIRMCPPSRATVGWPQ
jgi:hypothetical protein